MEKRQENKIVFQITTGHRAASEQGSTFVWAQPPAARYGLSLHCYATSCP